MAKYCLVEDGVIIDGPRRLPKSWRNISGLSLLSPVQLRTHGWLPYGDTKPEYNADTQYLTSAKTINSTSVTETYTINSYTEEEMTAKVETAKTKKLSELYANVKQFISYQPNGWPRYDNDLKLNIMNATMTAVAAGGTKPTNCTLVETWIYTVQTHFFALKTSVNAATTLEALRDIDVSYEQFEGKYGREGDTLVDPAISTDDLFS